METGKQRITPIQEGGEKKTSSEHGSIHGIPETMTTIRDEDDLTGAAPVHCSLSETPIYYSALYSEPARSKFSVLHFPFRQLFLPCEASTPAPTAVVEHTGWALVFGVLLLVKRL